jgi:cob(I)alamin adenosyltransferase
MDKQGLIQVYTGNGKGKTTAAFGLAIRALGNGWRVIIVQFLKGDKYGETNSMDTFPNCTVLQFGKDKLVELDSPDTTDINFAQQGLGEVAKIIRENQCDLLILDELNVALALKLVAEDKVLALLSERPKNMEIVITGRYAPQCILDCADLITEMQHVKHPFEAGIDAREGIEF